MDIIEVGEVYLLAYDSGLKIPRIVQIVEVLPDQHKVKEKGTIICKFITKSNPQHCLCLAKGLAKGLAKDLKPFTEQTVQSFKNELDVLISTVNKMTKELENFPNQT